MTFREPITACAQTRDLAARIARMVRAGDLDGASDRLEAELQRAYDKGLSDGHADR